MTSTRPDVVICATVEDMPQTTERITILRADWDAMTPTQRALDIESFGDAVLADSGGYGVGVESGADEETEVAVLPGVGSLIEQVERLSAALLAAGLTDDQVKAIKTGSA